MADSIDWAARFSHTVRWCSQRMDGGQTIDEVFRSRSLTTGELWARFCEQWGRQVVPARASHIYAGEVVGANPSIVESVVAAKEIEARLFEKSSFLRSGRIVAYRYRFTLSHGLARDESLGYVDTSECPGWDTWLGVAIDDDAPICWLPRQFVSLVQAGMDVDPVPTLVWIEELEPRPRRDELLRVNILCRSGRL